MAGDGILPQETGGKKLPTFSIGNRSLDEAQEQEAADRQIPIEIEREQSDNGPRIRKIGFRQRFYKAVRGGKLDQVKQLIQIDRELLRTRFTQFEQNAIQVAVVSGKEEIFTELMQNENFSKDILKDENKYGETILTLAAAQGSIKIVKQLVDKCPELVETPNKNGELPITVAASFGKEDIVSYLLYSIDKSILRNGGVEGQKDGDMTNSTQSSQHDDDFKVLKVSMTTQVSGHDERNYSFKLVNEDKDQAKSTYRSPYHCFRLFKACMSSQIYDVAFEVFELFPTCCITEMAEEKGETLNSLAVASIEQSEQNTFAARFRHFRACCLERWGNSWMPWSRFAKSLYENNYEKPARAQMLLRRICKQMLISDDPEKIIEGALSRPILTAVKHENMGFIYTVIEFCPEPMWVPVDELSPLSHAISRGLHKIYSYACDKPQTGLLMTMQPDRNGNTILHHAAMLSSPEQLQRSASPSLQMQREIQLFKKTEKMAPMCRGVVNKDNQTPIDLFKQQHGKLKKTGEKWLKEIASSCSLVATLIVTVMFTAAFTAPGGYNDAGSPVYLGSKNFTVFIISDALSLFFSCTSAMVFLGIYTSLFREQDFLIRLPLTLICGLFTLFLSIVTMVIAFGAALILTLSERFVWVALPLLVLASIPVIIYSIMYLRIFIDVLCSTLSHLFRQ